MRRWLMRLARWGVALALCGPGLWAPAWAVERPIALVVSPDLIFAGQMARARITGLRDPQAHYVLRLARAEGASSCQRAMLIPRAPALAGQAADPGAADTMLAEAAFPWPVTQGPGVYVVCAFTQSGGSLVATSPVVHVISPDEPSAVAEPSWNLSGGEVVHVTVRHLPGAASALSVNLRSLANGQVADLPLYNVAAGPAPEMTIFDLALPEHMRIGAYQLTVRNGDLTLQSNTLAVRSPQSVRPATLAATTTDAARQPGLPPLSLVGAIILALALLTLGLATLPALRLRRTRNPELWYSNLDP